MQRIAFFVLLVFVFAIPFERNVAIPGIGALGTAIGLLLVAVGVLAHYQENAFRFRRPSVLLALGGAFVAWSALTFFWSAAPMETLRLSVTYAQLLVMVWLVWQLCRTTQERHALMQAYVLGGYVAISVVIFNFATGNFVIEGSTGARYSFAGGNPNWLALTLAVGIPLAWHLATSNVGFWRSLLNVLYIVLTVFVVGLTGSRGGFVTAIAALTVIPLTYLYLGLWKKIALVAVLVAAVYGAFGYLPQANFERLAGTTDEITEGSLTGRTDIWQAGWQVLVNDEAVALLGAGTGSYRHVVEEHLGSARPSHNAYLSVLVENGIVGFLLFAAILLVALLPLFGLPAAVRNIYLVLWLTLAVSLVPANIERQKHVWFLLAIMTTERAYVLGRTREPNAFVMPAADERIEPVGREATAWR